MKFHSAGILCPILLTLTTAYSQKIAINGYIKDATSKEALIGASIFIANNNSGTTTNQYGFFSLTVPVVDTIELIVSFTGYSIQAKKITAKRNLRLDIFLEPIPTNLGEVVVSAERNDHNIKKPQMGVVDVPLKAIKNLPVLFGERDVMKVIQLLPGVQSGNEGTTGFYVRGGNLDQNLVLLDEATIYNPNHIFGLFSTFNVNALNSVRLIKGGFPAEFGGRLSSIVNVTMKEGNKTKYQVEGGIGVLSANLTLQGPIQKNKSSFIVSARTGNINYLLRLYGDAKKSTNYNFYDLNAKINYEFSKKDQVFLSFFNGNDDASYRNANSLNYTTEFGNSTGTFRWNHLFGNKIFSNISLIYDDYNLALSTSQNNYYSLLYTAVQDLTAKTDLTIRPSSRHTIKAGFIFTRHRLSPASFSSQIPGNGIHININKDSIDKFYSNEMAFYAGDEFEVSKKISLNYGLRFPFFTDTGKSYSFIEPRVTGKVSIGRASSIKASYTKMNQFLHLIPNSTAGLPTDIWIPSGKQTKPQSSFQYAIGYFRNFKENKFESSVEFYYKEMGNQVLFGEGKQLRINVNLDSLLVYGKGESFGMEFFVKKNTGKLTGWVSYTLSKTTQQFNDLNYGQDFPFKYDRRHVLSIAASYQLTKAWMFSSVFAFATGAPFTVPTGRISSLNSATIFEGNYYVYEGRNNYRLKSYHRLDISASNKKTVKIFKGRYEREWVFGLYNAYSRLNPYFVYFEIDPITQSPTAKQVTLLPIVPSVSFNFKF